MLLCLNGLSRKSAGEAFFFPALMSRLTALKAAKSLGDLAKLLEVLDDLTARGDTVVVVEHNLDLIRNADWVVDLGPDGGDRGGELVAEGPPAAIMASEGSWTGRYLRDAHPNTVLARAAGDSPPA